MDQRTFPDSPHGRRARLLVEDPNPALHVAEFRHFHDAGFDVALCPGPDAEADGCPLVHGGTCQLAEQADVVLIPSPSTAVDPTTARLVDLLGW